MSWNWSGAGEGAATGASAGAIAGPYGAAIGGVVGAIGGGLFGGSASQPGLSANAQMSDAEYAWYKQNILPLQQKVYNSAFDPTQINAQINTAQSDVDTQYAKAPAAYQRQMAAQGIAATPSQMANFTKQQKLNQGIADAGIRNATRSSIAQQQAGILGTT